MGSTINEWGPCAWNTLHVTAHNFPHHPTDEDRKKTHTFLFLFANHLPCPTCREHFLGLLTDGMPKPSSGPLETRKSLIVFLHDAHNEVNRRRGKREVSLSRHYEVYDRESDREPGVEQVCASVLAWTIVLTILALVLFRPGGPAAHVWTARVRRVRGL